MASAIPAFEIDFSSYFMAPPSARPRGSRTTDLANQHKQRIVKLIHHSLLQRNDGVVGDMNFFRANFRTALGDVAKPDAELLLQQAGTRNTVERMHFQPRDADKEARPAELFALPVVAQDVADVLAQ